MTYSIVARDRETGELGVAVQSQAFNAGAAVPWARPGVGAVATQSFTDRRYGWRGLELLAAGTAAPDALERLRDGDPLVELRQVGVMGADGSSAQWTGAHCVRDAGHARGAEWIAQANMVASPRVWEDMGAAFDAAEGELALRLMAALEAAEEAGGDWRGRGGAAIVVVGAEGEPWERIVDLRVEEGDASLAELRRLLERALAYRAAARAPHERASIGRAAGLPEAHILLLEVQDAGSAGDIPAARAALGALERTNPRWRDMLRATSRLPGMEQLAALLDE